MRLKLLHCDMSKRAGALLVVALLASCGTDPVAPPATADGQWGLSVVAGPSCAASLPSGFAVAPRGGGKAFLTQNGNRLSGLLYIFDGFAGTLEGTLTGNDVRFTFTLDGRNVGVLSPEHEPCRVVGSAVGTTDYNCFLSARLEGSFACPYSCAAADHLVMLRRCR